MIVHRAVAEARGRGMCERLEDLIPRHLFNPGSSPGQAAIGGKVIARETIAALRKDVTAKCGACPGEGRGRRHHAQEEAAGEAEEARMREYGNVSIPQEAFIAAPRMGEE